MRAIRVIPLGLVLALVLTLSACGEGRGSTVHAAKDGSPDASQAQENVTSFDGERVDVGDSSGAVVGSMSNAEDAQRRGRIREQVIELMGGRRDFPQADVDRLVGALEVLDPVRVTDAQGELTGYLVRSFVPLDEYPAMRAKAQSTIDEFKREHG